MKRIRCSLSLLSSLGAITRLQLFTGFINKSTPGLRIKNNQATISVAEPVINESLLIPAHV